MNIKYEDSTGRRIKIGDVVRHRGIVYIIESFSDQGASRVAVINFQGTEIRGDELSVDKVTLHTRIHDCPVCTNKLPEIDI